MNPVEVNIIRADTDVHWGVNVDSLVVDDKLQAQRFGGEIRIDKRLPGLPSLRVKAHFDGLRDVWKKHSGAPSTFIDAMEMITKQLIDAPLELP